MINYLPVMELSFLEKGVICRPLRSLKISVSSRRYAYFRCLGCRKALLRGNPSYSETEDPFGVASGSISDARISKKKVKNSVVPRRVKISEKKYPFFGRPRISPEILTPPQDTPETCNMQIFERRVVNIREISTFGLWA